MVLVVAALSVTGSVMLLTIHCGQAPMQHHAPHPVYISIDYFVGTLAVALLTIQTFFAIFLSWKTWGEDYNNMEEMFNVEE